MSRGIRFVRVIPNKRIFMIIPKILRKVIKILNLKHRIIFRDAEGKDKYLTRYYIFRKTKWWMPSIYIHCFHSSDLDTELHNHPWNSSLSLILSGKYREEYRDKNNNVKERRLHPGCFNYITKNKFHRIDLLNNEVWTLFISGSKMGSWGFWDRYTYKFEYWQEHEARKKLEKLNNSPTLSA